MALMNNVNFIFSEIHDSYRQKMFVDRKEVCIKEPCDKASGVDLGEVSSVSHLDVSST